MNTGNKGRFSERIKRIANNRRKSKNNADDKKGAIKRILLFPLMLLDKKIYTRNTDVSVDNKRVKYTNIKDNVSLNNKNNSKNTVIKKKIYLNNVNLIDKNINKKTDLMRVIKYNNINKSDNHIRAYDVTQKDNHIRVSDVTQKDNHIRVSDVTQKDNHIRVFDVTQKDNRIKVSKVNKNTGEFPQPLIVSSTIIDKTNTKKGSNVAHNRVVSSRNNNRGVQSTVVSTINEVKDIELNTKIINDIEKYLIKNISNLDAIESDLYVLSKFDGDKESLEKCREYIAKLHALQNKLNKLRKQFNILKENTDFSDVLEMDDNKLLDKIIAFRDSVDNNIAMQTTKNYKLLEEYKYLYFKIDKVISDTYVLENEVSTRKRDLENTNVSFNEFQKRIYNLDKVEEETSKMLEKQNKILEQLKEKVSTIEVTKKVEYIYGGFLDILFNGLKLLGLYMLSPFRKSMPGIAVATLATKKTMNNLLDTMNVEKRNKYVYSATDYSNILTSSISDLNSLDNLIISTLLDIRNVKNEFIFRFSPYVSNLSKYNSVLHKINKLEKLLINNQVKVRILSEKMKDKKIKNDQTLIKVRKLNNNS